MSCTNCYNGCSEINSDQCIKYTGIDVPGLGITNGDTLLSIEETIFNYIQSFMIGEEIVPILDPSILCKIINDNLPICSGCTEIFLNDILTAIIKSVCDLETEIANINNELDILNADYTIGCLTGVTASSDTHSILQAVITNLCTLNSAVSALTLSLNSYALISNIPGYIEDFIDNDPAFTLYSSRMVPYVAVPYFGNIGNFDLSGAGLGNYARIFLCNGQNPGVPDLRGRVLVGATSMSAAGFDPAVDPAISGNPAYSLNTTQGANQITLGVLQIPSHSHLTTVTINDPGHIHNLKVNTNAAGSGFPAFESATAVGTFDTESAQTELKGTGVGQNVFVTNANTGGNLPHSNIQPVHACYYIIYIPAP